MYVTTRNYEMLILVISTIKYKLLALKRQTVEKWLRFEMMNKMSRIDNIRQNMTKRDN